MWSTPKSRTQFRFITRSAAQTRILDAALKLIAEHGVGGTSLQMIADAIGVTKAAVYHQFKTKEQIVVALTERELGGLEEALEAAEAHDDFPQAREVLLGRVIDMAIERRGAASTLQFDPVIVRLLAEQEQFQQFIARLYGVLVDDTGRGRAGVGGDAFGRHRGRGDAPSGRRHRRRHAAFAAAAYHPSSDRCARA